MDTGLRYRYCRWCRTPTDAGRLLCPACGADDLAEAGSTGGGTIRRFLPTASARQRRQLCVIRLDEGFTLRGALLGVLPGAVSLGAAVRRTAAAPGRDPAFVLVPEQSR
ncbi:hypothetical protein [Streptacidiphilus sp. EB129]|uniref:hypothetical protein n=1 Tax=Streptacidiphilus sp. EB129 TaxID=3156262 RepID=UPI0035127960